jgi:hypothetical protein
MKALLIPANSSKPVTEIDFDQDKSWRYVITGYDPGLSSLATDVAFLAKRNAPRDYLVKNSRASEYLRDAATDQTDGTALNTIYTATSSFWDTTRRCLTTSLTFPRTLTPKTSSPLGSVVREPQRAG